MDKFSMIDFTFILFLIGVVVAFLGGMYLENERCEAAYQERLRSKVRSVREENEFLRKEIRRQQIKNSTFNEWLKEVNREDKQ